VDGGGGGGGAGGSGRDGGVLETGGVRSPSRSPSPSRETRERFGNRGYRARGERSAWVGPKRKGAPELDAKLRWGRNGTPPESEFSPPRRRVRYEETDASGEPTTRDVRASDANTAPASTDPKDPDPNRNPDPNLDPNPNPKRPEASPARSPEALVATTCVRLRGVLTRGDLEDATEAREILEDTEELCRGEFGALAARAKARGFAPEPLPDPPGVGEVFLRFEEVEAATRAVKNLRGRTFAGRTVDAAFASAETFEKV
jgi:hypothetical protein